jgi:hypothetical protein
LDMSVRVLRPLAAVAPLARVRDPVVPALVVGVQRLREHEPVALAVPTSPSRLFAMARNFTSRVTKAMCGPAPRCRCLPKDQKSLSV